MDNKNKERKTIKVMGLIIVGLVIGLFLNVAGNSENVKNNESLLSNRDKAIEEATVATDTTEEEIIEEVEEEIVEEESNTDSGRVEDQNEIFEVTEENEEVYEAVNSYRENVTSKLSRDNYDSIDDFEPLGDMTSTDSSFMQTTKVKYYNESKAALDNELVRVMKEIEVQITGDNDEYIAGLAFDALIDRQLKLDEMKLRSGISVYKKGA